MNPLNNAWKTAKSTEVTQRRTKDNTWGQRVTSDENPFQYREDCGYWSEFLVISGFLCYYLENKEIAWQSQWECTILTQWYILEMVWIFVFTFGNANTVLPCFFNMCICFCILWLPTEYFVNIKFSYYSNFIFIGMQ